MTQGSVYIRWQLCCAEAVYRSAYAVACCYAVLCALFFLEVILLAIHNRIDANPQSGTVRTNGQRCYNELYLVQISGLWVHLGTIKHNTSLPATLALNALVTLLLD